MTGLYNKNIGLCDGKKIILFNSMKIARMFAGAIPPTRDRRN
jgi:hypothetical protein